MKNNSPSPQSSEHSERVERPDHSVRQADLNDPIGENSEQAQMDALMQRGFVWDEAVKLFYLRDHLYSNGEMQQRIANDHHMQFMRWLYEQGELQES
ncbi:MAG TPA: hypothetical protein VGT44_08020 [Ktedonobacteraceae bacterium]|nr:hypothetical protein [Ktedonobacteraceae bacterium]